MANGQNNSQDNSKVDMSLLWKDFPQFKDAVVRIDQKTNTASVLDVVALVLGGRDTARQAWKALKDNKDPSVSELVSRTHGLKINGKGNETDTAPFRTLLEIIFLLPGKRAHEFRKSSAQYIARLLSGDLSLIEEIEARYDGSTAEEREFFRSGTDETPDRKRRREELEHERRLRLRREAAEIQRLEMENVQMYRGLLEDFGLDKDPRMRMLLNDTVANILVPNSTFQAIEGSTLKLSDYVTVAKFLVDRGIKDRSSSALGRVLAKKWREEEGGEPNETTKMVQGDMRPVKVYPVSFLEKHVLE